MKSTPRCDFRRSHALWGLVWFALLTWCVPTHAQLTATPAAGSPSGASAVAPAAPRPGTALEGGVRNAPLNARVFLPESDQNPRLIPMPNFTLEDFDRLQQLRDRFEKGQDVPPYRLQSMVASGRARPGDRHVRLSIALIIMTRQQETLVVPLGLREGAIPLPADLRVDEPFRYVGPGQVSLHYTQAAREGYECVIHGRARADDDFAEEPGGTEEIRHELYFDLLVPIRRIGDAYHLMLTCPRAVSSELRLDVDIDGVVANVPESSVLESKPFVSTAAGGPPSGAGTSLVVRNLAGTFEMSWHEPSKPAADTASLLKVENALIVASLDNRASDVEVTLPIRSYGMPFRECHIRLPKGVHWNADNSPDYQIEEVHLSTIAEPMIAPAEDMSGTGRIVGTSSASTGGGPLLLVRFAQATQGPVTVRFRTRRVLLAREEAAWFELGGIEVLEAEEMSGNVAVKTFGDWPIRWGALEGVSRIDRLPEPLEAERLAGRFEFYRQPFSIPARVVRRQTQINVKPEYHITVERGRATLRAVLTYNVSGAAAEQLDINLRGWRYIDATAAAIDREWITISEESGNLTLPLLLPPPGPIQIVLHAYYPLSPDATQLAFELPQPIANWEDQAIVAIQPVDNVELIPLQSEIQGLARQVRPRQPLEAMSDAVARQQEPFFYRGDTATAKFVATMTLHTQQIGVDMRTDVRILKPDGQIVQTFDFDVQYEPVERLEFLVPRVLAESQSIAFTFGNDNQPLQETAGTIPPSETTIARRVLLPRACIGPCVIRAHYGMRPVNPQPQRSAFVSVPLVVPFGAELKSNEVRIESVPGVRVLWDETRSPWHLDEVATRDEPPHVLRLASVTPEQQISLTVNLEDRGVLGTTVVDRVWYQTWTGPGRRRDRVVFRFTSARDRFEWTMPPQADLGGMEVLLDGKAVENLIVENGNQVAAPLGAMDPLKTHVLELRYFMPAPVPRGARYAYQFPALPEHVLVRRTYWQLVLPATYHLINPPVGMTPEFRWGWNRIYCGRVPLMEQHELEFWSGGSQLTPVPEATSRYLFSTLGPINDCEALIASRTTLVFTASGVALVFGLLIIYFPLLRTPAVLLFAAVAFCATAALQPAPTLLLAQASSLGIITALMAGLLYRSLARNRWGGRDVGSSLFERERPSAASPSLGVKADDSDSGYRLSNCDLEP